MLNFSLANRLIEMLPEEIRLVYQARSGDSNAFIKLYDACVDRVYGYVYFQVADDQVAEGITFQVVFNAWKQLGANKISGFTFVFWLYSIAQDQINFHHRTHKKAEASEQDFLKFASPSTDQEEDGVFNLRTIRTAVQFLTKEEQQALILKFIIDVPNKTSVRLMGRHSGDVRVLQFRALQALAGYLENKELRINTKDFQRVLEECQTKLSSGRSTVDECLAASQSYAAQIEPFLRTIFSLNQARDLKPSPTFTAYTRATLLHYILTHPRRAPRRLAFSSRMSVSFASVVMTLLLTVGTVYAQSALPGETFYTWKRTSEVVWRAFSLDPLATDIALADRRLSEWIAVADNPAQSVNAMNGYLEALAKLEFHEDVQTLAVIVPALQVQHQSLDDAGLTAPQLDDFLSVAVVLVSVDIPTEIPATSTATEVASTATEVPTEIAPTATEIPPTEVVPTATEVPAEIVPTATRVPTATDVPTATEVPTEVPTTTPTEIVPTDIPTEGPTETPTFVPEATPTEAIP